MNCTVTSFAALHTDNHQIRTLVHWMKVCSMYVCTTCSDIIVSIASLNTQEVQCQSVKLAARSSCSAIMHFFMEDYSQ